jgi:hypothetical protein
MVTMTTRAATTAAGRPIEEPATIWTPEAMGP